MLVTQVGQVVTVEQLVDELWPDDPPASAVPNVRTYAANLRRAFEATPAGHGILTRRRDGYLLDVDPGRVDLTRFTNEVREGRAALRSADPSVAADLFSRALERWRGPMLAGVPVGPALSARTTAAAEQHLLAQELLAESWIRSGRYERAVPLLEQMLGEHPLREPAHVLLMRALSERGDRAGAILAYRRARDLMSRHLGVEPSAELDRLHAALRHPPPLEAAAKEPPTAAPAPGPPPGAEPEPRDWLPRSTTDFVGRAEVIAGLLEETARVEQRVPPVHLIDGMAGSGKTTVAVHVARLLAHAYPDAQLFLDLKGHGAEAAVDPSAALVTLLRQLGVPAGRIPAETDLRIELWRRELSTRRSVVVLDNAADGRQVQPLLPTRPGTVVIVTSRRRLADLDTGPSRPLSLLSESEALTLLATTIGPDRVAAEPEAAAEVVRCCGHLPLAIKLVGSRLARRRTWSLAELAEELSAEALVLNRLGVGERTVRSAFAASYEPLDPEARRVFRLLGVPDGGFSAAFVAALTDLPLTGARRVLDDLVDRHLVEEIAGDRYRLHDLIRQYARERSDEQDGFEVRREAVERLLDFALHASLSAAVDLPHAVDVRAEVNVGDPVRPDLFDVQEFGVDWLERERANLVALVGLAADYQVHSYAWKLARAIWRFFFVRGYFDHIVETHRLGLAAAETLGDDAAVASMCNYLASALVKTGSYREACAYLDHAVALCQRNGDRALLSKFRANLSVVYWIRGDLEESVLVGQQSLRQTRTGTIPMALPNLGLALTSLGRYDEATRAHRHHLFAARVQGDRFHMANALSHLAAVRVRRGQWRQAVRLLRPSLMLFGRTGHRYGESDARNVLGVAYRMGGLLDEARRQHEMALELAEDSGERPAQCAALNDLGFTLAAAGATDAARRTHEQGLALATRFEHPYEQGRALAGLAEHALSTDVAEARRYWERALAIFRRMGVPERFEVERRLTDVDDHPTRRL